MTFLILHKITDQWLYSIRKTYKTPITFFSQAENVDLTLGKRERLKLNRVLI